MDEKKIEAYFKQQVRAMMARSVSQPEGFLSYFAEREPKDEEILGLLAVSAVVSGEFDLTDLFPTPVEALAALSPSGRSKLCQEFRKELEGTLRLIAGAA